ncbi:PREDICTED: EF-hand domain-containing protein 1-like [Ceratosolen solmsi marchali]|uniref:EF-hand domain-containing protein 1-like n=1 Tax=Ceratosolen solmsi marchali TaxID=326594 RepID=A0AAJ6YVA3_9HYME|nr:PREDICTED: EF-hand domain-containing protein 1-like [Ceratosolen solmsi marchali]
MSYLVDMESLPLLPGYTFSNCNSTSKDYKLKQKLKFLNGFRVIHDYNGTEDFLSNVKLAEYDPKFTYGHRKDINKEEWQIFLPKHVIFAQQCLKFEAYFKQSTFGSDNECYRVRRVNIFFYLEDDTMAVIEPPVKNVGFKQGKLVSRGKILKSKKPLTYYHWKDLNIGLDIGIYGVVYHIINCDLFSRNFLNRQGIDVPEGQNMPPDPYIHNRTWKESLEYRYASTKDKANALVDDQRYRFLEYDRMVLSFEAIWNNDLYKIQYYLSDNTIAIFVLRHPNESKKIGGSMLLKRTKVPKNWKDLPSTYPRIYAEKTEADVSEYYAPSDLQVGETIFIFGRRFLLYDCDLFTRKYYSDMLRIEQPERINLPDKVSNVYPERTPKSIDLKSDNNNQNVIRKLYHFPKKLRYTLTMDVVHPEDEGREFILEYSLADGSIRIIERYQCNSGRIPGCFLNWICVPKPDNTEYYTPNDFRIGDKINILGHWFIITGTELFVYNYVLSNPEKFDESVRQSIEGYLKQQGLIDEPKHCDEAEPDKITNESNKTNETK